MGQIYFLFFTTQEYPLPAVVMSGFSSPIPGVLRLSGFGSSGEAEGKPFIQGSLF